MIEKRPLGETPLRISRIGFGCGTGAGLMTGNDTDLQRQVIEYAVNEGISFFDVASVYGDGLAEKNLGLALRGVKDEVTVGTKIALQWGDLDDIYNASKRELLASLDRLGMPRVALLQIHNHIGLNTERDLPEAPGPRLGLEHMLGHRGVLEAFHKLKSEGLVETIAFTSFGGEVQAMTELLDHGGFDATDVEFNVRDQSKLRDCIRCGGIDPSCDHESIISLAVKRGVGMFSIRPLAGGSRAPVSVPNAVHEQIDKLVEEGVITSFAEGALRFVLGVDTLSSVVLGMYKLEHIRSAVAAARLGPLPELQLQA